MNRLTVIFLSLCTMVFLSCDSDDDEAVYTPSINKAEMDFTFQGTTEDNTIEITCNQPWTISPSAAWITVSPSQGTGNATVHVYAAGNPLTMDRTGSITLLSPNAKFISVDLKIKQVTPGNFDVFSAITDANFKALCNTFDTNADGVLSFAEAYGVAAIDASSLAISSFKGIEYFTSLYNFDCSDNPIQSLDLSKNRGLDSLACANTGLSTLDLSANTSLAKLNCNNNRITTLDISKNSNLQSLYCEDNKFVSLDISKNWALKKLHCDNNPTLKTIYVWKEFNISKPSEKIPDIKYPAGVSFVVKTETAQ